MRTAANVVVALVALLHVYFLILEMFLWERPWGLRTFGMTPARAAETKVLAGNQGLYNGFLAGGLSLGCGLAQQATPLWFSSWPVCWSQGSTVRRR